MITLAYRGSASAIITAQTLPLNPCWSPFIRGKNSAGLRPRQPKYPELDHPGLIDLGERPACARAVDRKNRVRFGGRFFREISGPVLTRIFPTPRTGPKRVRSGGRFFPFEGSSTTESRRGRIPFYRREKPLQRHPRCLELCWNILPIVQSLSRCHTDRQNRKTYRRLARDVDWNGDPRGKKPQRALIVVDHLTVKVHAPTAQQRENGDLQLRLRIALVALGRRCFGGPKRRTIALTTREAGEWQLKPAQHVARCEEALSTTSRSLSC